MTEKQGACALAVELPWPPTVNHYYGLRRGGGRFIKPRGQEFRASVLSAVERTGLQEPLLGRLRIQVMAMPPDRRIRDLDNLWKATLDALAHAGVVENDCQFKEKVISESARAEGGKLLVRISRLSDDWNPEWIE